MIGAVDHVVVELVGVIEVGVVLSWLCLRSVSIAVVGVDVVGLRAYVCGWVVVWLCVCVGGMCCTRCEDNAMKCIHTQPQFDDSAGPPPHEQHPS